MSTTTLWLVNPKGLNEKGSKTKMSKPKKARTAAQKAATAKMIAARKRLSAAKHGGSGSSSKPKKARTYKKNPVTPLKRRKYRRNPLPAKAQRGVDILGDNVIPALVGAGGAIAFDLVWGKLPIPDSLRASSMKYPAKIAGALALGVLAEHMLPENHRHHAVNLARGGLTCIFRDAAKDFIQTNYPSLSLAAYEADTLAEVMQLNETMRLAGYQGAPVGEQALIEQAGGGGALQMNNLQGLGNAFWNQPVYPGVAY